jgi:hypothetical protein
VWRARPSWPSSRIWASSCVRRPRRSRRQWSAGSRKRSPPIRRSPGGRASDPRTRAPRRPPAVTRRAVTAAVRTVFPPGHRAEVWQVPIRPLPPWQARLPRPRRRRAPTARPRAVPARAAPVWRARLAVCRPRPAALRARPAAGRYRVRPRPVPFRRCPVSAPRRLRRRTAVPPRPGVPRPARARARDRVPQAARAELPRGPRRVRVLVVLAPAARRARRAARKRSLGSRVPRVRVRRARPVSVRRSRDRVARVPGRARATTRSARRRPAWAPPRRPVQVRAPAKATVIVIAIADRVLACLARPVPVPPVPAAGVPAGLVPAHQAATARTPVVSTAVPAAPVLAARVPAARVPAR